MQHLYDKVTNNSLVFISALSLVIPVVPLVLATSGYTRFLLQGKLSYAWFEGDNMSTAVRDELKWESE